MAKRRNCITMADIRRINKKRVSNKKYERFEKRLMEEWYGKDNSCTNHINE